MLPKTAGCATGTGVEVAKGAETGGGATWGERPWIFLPLPLLLLFFGALIAKDMAQVTALSFEGLVATLVEDGLTNGPFIGLLVYLFH